MAFLPHLIHSLTQTVEKVFPYSLFAWRLNTRTQLSLKKEMLYKLVLTEEDVC